jgi:hypothetical protein
MGKDKAFPEDFENFFHQNMEFIASFKTLKGLKGFEFYQAIRTLVTNFFDKNKFEVDIEKIKKSGNTLLQWELIDSAYIYNLLLYVDILQSNDLNKDFLIQSLDKNIKPDIRSQYAAHWYKAIAGIFSVMIKRADNGPANTARKIIASAFGLSESDVKYYYQKFNKTPENKNSDNQLSHLLIFLMFATISSKNIDWEKERKKASRSPNSKKAYDGVINRYYWIRQLIGFKCIESLKEILQEYPPLIKLFITGEQREIILGCKDANSTRFDDRAVLLVSFLCLMIEFFPKSLRDEQSVQAISALIKHPG